MPGALRVSEAAALAIHTALILARRPVRWVTAGELAGDLRASRAHLAKVLQRLGKAGLVESVRGTNGGFRLAPRGAAVSLLEIYEAIEGKLEPPACMLSRPLCAGTECVLGGVITHLNRELRDQLESVKLSELLDAKGVATGTDDDRRRRNRNGDVLLPV